MASEGPREPAGEGIKLSADVKPFVPKFAGLNVVWSESSEARVFPSCAARYYPCAQELPGPEQKLYTEDVAFGASAFPPQYLSSELAVHPCSYSPYPVESTPRVCPVPGAPYAYGHPGCYRAFQTVKPRSEQKKTYDEQKFDSKKADGSLPSDLKSDGYHRRTDRRSRIIEKSASASKPEFEFTRMDFPELQGPENREIAETPKQPRWGPLRSASADLSLLGEVGEPAAGTAEGEGAARSPSAAESVAAGAAAGPSSCARELSWTPMGYVVRQTLSTERPPAPKNVTSMINLKTVASSADPKSASMSPSEVFSADPSCKEKHVHPTKKSKASQGGDPEQNEASRKHKKKKEKSKSKYEVLTIQEPPRIEDAEDFPSLAAASERRDRGSSPRLQSRQQPQNNFKNSGKKSQVPVQLDLGGMLAALEKKQHAQSARVSSKPVVFSGKGFFIPTTATERGPGVRWPLNRGKEGGPATRAHVGGRDNGVLTKRASLRRARASCRQGENGSTPDGMPQTVLFPPDFDGAPAEGTEESAAPTPTGQRKSEEPPRTEPQKEADGLCLVPDGAGCPRIHSRRFRDYCSQMLSKEVDACVTDLLRELVRFQDRMYQKDPVKAKTKRRLVLGLREVLKHLKLRKLKCIIISPNCEKIQSKGGLDDTLHTIIGYACEQNIPFVFALNRKALGRSLNKAVPVSVVGIFSYDGAQDQFHRMVELTMAARQAYKTMLENARQEPAGEPGPPAPGSPPPQGPPAPAAGRDEPRYMEIWREHLEAYSRGALELEDSLEASTSQMMNLNL
uniref:selenocysteine insertion sequence-binding protein 2 n=1 Tax=Panthera onca TaxID=9690 RepID=UPI0029545EAF|nr:selenocysteine insertion sequence-binding protein 2 [Panthera onca]